MHVFKLAALAVSVQVVRFVVLLVSVKRRPNKSLLARSIASVHQV